MLSLLALGLTLTEQVPPCLSPVAACVRNYQPDTTEQILTRITSHGPVMYGRGCDGTPPCKKNRFDCSGIIHDARRYVGYYTGRKLNGFSMMAAGVKIPYTKAKRGDYVRFEHTVEGDPDHIAIIASGRNGETIGVLDTFAVPGQVTARPIIINNGWYAGKYKIHTMRLDYGYTVAINRATGKPYRYKK